MRSFCVLARVGQINQQENDPVLEAVVIIAEISSISGVLDTFISQYIFMSLAQTISQQNRSANRIMVNCCLAKYHQQLPFQQRNFSWPFVHI